MLNHFHSHHTSDMRIFHPLSFGTPGIVMMLLFFITISMFAILSPASTVVAAGVEDKDTGEDALLIDTTQQKASEMLLDAAEWFDSFFDDNRRYDSELNQSRAKLKLSTKFTDEGDIDISPRFQWRIHLPKISKKTNLILFASEDDDDDFGSGSTDSPIDETRSRDDYGAALQQFFKIGEKYNISGTLGASSSSVYGGLRYRYYRDLGSWQSRIVDRLRYYTDDGWENILSLDLERHISQKWLFRSTASLYWYEQEDGLPYDLSFILYRFLSERRALSLEWYNTFETSPHHELTDIQLQLRYRQQIHKNWLLYEIKPRVNFPEENDREPEFSIYFILEAKFGREDGKKIINVFRF